MTKEEAIILIKSALKTMYLPKSKEYISDLGYALEIAIKAIEQEPCEDAISRQAVIDGINRYFHDEYYQRTSIQDCRDCFIEDVIKKLPPVNPQPKTGKWMETDSADPYWYMCSECHRRLFEQEAYCPSCGAKMK